MIFRGPRIPLYARIHSKIYYKYHHFVYIASSDCAAYSAVRVFFLNADFFVESCMQCLTIRLDILVNSTSQNGHPSPNKKKRCFDKPSDIKKTSILNILTISNYNINVIGLDLLLLFCFIHYHPNYY